MVTFNVAQLLQEPPGAVRTFDFSERLPDPSDDLSLRGPVRGHARLTHTSRGVLVQTTYRTGAVLACGRCLEAVQVSLLGTFDEEYLPTTDVRTGLPRRVEDDPLDTDVARINDHHEVVLDEALRQDILTRVPMQTLCSQACLGLCATCGQRRDAPSHPQHAEDAAPSVVPDTHQPFAGLAELLRARGIAPEDRRAS